MGSINWTTVLVSLVIALGGGGFALVGGLLIWTLKRLTAIERDNGRLTEIAERANHNGDDLHQRLCKLQDRVIDTLLDGKGEGTDVPDRK